MDVFSPQHIVLILLIVLIFFGGKKIPELMRGLGTGIREFKDAKDNVTREIKDQINNEPANNNTNTTNQTKQVSSGTSTNS
jgi:sec-independent protein translocase protein TatA